MQCRRHDVNLAETTIADTDDKMFTCVESMMRPGSLLAVSALFLLAAPVTASAADMPVPAPNAGASTACPPPAVQVASRAPLKTLTTLLFRQRGQWVQPPRVVMVEPFHGVTPGPAKYVPAQTAYLASSRCPPVLGPSAGGSWYDGKVFYYDGTTPHRPDTFMVVIEPAVAHRPKRRR